MPCAGGWIGRNGLTVVGMDAEGFAMGGLAVVAAAYFFGPLYGAALVLSVIIHEFGHVAAYRVAGHSDARFRLIPLMGGVAISNQLPASHVKDFFIALLGPGICIAPMVLGFVLADMTYYTMPEVSRFLWIFASVTAILNFFNLLPFWPLDGGRCLRIIAYNIWPGLANMLTVGMSAALVAAGVWLQSFILVIFAIMGAQSIMHADTIARIQHPMSWSQTATTAAAYLFTMAAHLAGGWEMLSFYL